MRHKLTLPTLRGPPGAVNTLGLELNPQALGQYIDHTLLRPDATEEQVRKVCEEAREYHFKTVCIEGKWLTKAARWLAGSSVLPIAVVAFPHGQGTPEEKASEAANWVVAGAKEIDMVLNRQLLKAHDYQGLHKDVASVVNAVAPIPVKVILETSELTDDEKKIACAISQAAGAAFVKTSTGFSKSGATESDVRLMRSVVGPTMGVKASGGVRSYEDAVKMIQAGANRIGTSSGVAMVQGRSGEAGKY